MQKGVQAALSFHPLQSALGERHGADFAVFDQVGLLGNGQIEDVAHSSTNAGTANPPPALRGASARATSLARLGSTVSGLSGAPSTATCVVSLIEAVSSSASEFTY